MNLFANSRFQLTFITMLLGLAAIHAGFLFFQNYAIDVCIIEPIYSLILLWMLCYLQGNLLGYYAPQQSRQLFIIGWAAVFAIIWSFALWFLVKMYAPAGSIYYHQFKSALALRTFVAWLFICAIGFYNILWQSQQYQLQMQDAQDEVKQLAKDAELFKLRQQVQPHFLFNSLNSINALITIEPKQARVMIQQLSDFLRATLKKEEKELITLAEELNYINLYMEIEKVRFGHRLSIEKKIEEGCYNIALPNLILQPVIENAIKYGLYNTIKSVMVTLEAYKKDKNLILIISNPFDAQAVKNSSKSTGFGLKAVNRRLQLVYGMPNLITTYSSNEIFYTQLIIPQ